MAKRKKQSEWQLTVEFVPFATAEARERAYDLWATSFVELLTGSTPPAENADRRDSCVRQETRGRASGRTPRRNDDVNEACQKEEANG